MGLYNTEEHKAFDIPRYMYNIEEHKTLDISKGFVQLIGTQNTQHTQWLCRT